MQISSTPIIGISFCVYEHIEERREWGGHVQPCDVFEQHVPSCLPLSSPGGWVECASLVLHVSLDPLQTCSTLCPEPLLGICGGACAVLRMHRHSFAELASTPCMGLGLTT